jgi:hypothetical protein
MPRPIKITRIPCEVIDDTEKAIQIKTDNGIWWVPKSCLFDPDEVPSRGHAEVAIEDWLVEKEEIH